MRHKIPRQQSGDQMRSDRLTGPFSPPSDKLPPILLHQSQDRRSLNAKDGGELLEKVVVDVAGLLKPDDLISRSDEARVSEELGNLTWAQIQIDSLPAEMVGKIRRHKEEKTAARAGTWESQNDLSVAGIVYYFLQIEKR
jgi:uncharacterized lipoprotein YmbA